MGCFNRCEPHALHTTLKQMMARARSHIHYTITPEDLLEMVEPEHIDAIKTMNQIATPNSSYVSYLNLSELTKAQVVVVSLEYGDIETCYQPLYTVKRPFILPDYLREYQYRLTADKRLYQKSIQYINIMSQLAKRQEQTNELLNWLDLHCRTLAQAKFIFPALGTLVARSDLESLQARFAKIKSPQNVLSVPPEIRAQLSGITQFLNQLAMLPENGPENKSPVQIRF